MWIRKSLLAVGLVCACLPGRALAEDDARTIYFFSPETNINNFGALKREFDAYFAGFDGQKFQPFSIKEDFEAFMQKQPNGLFLMSSWHYQQLPDKKHFMPLLVGRLKEKITQKHLIFVEKHIQVVEGVENNTIATAGSPEFTMTLLRKILGDEEELLESFELLVVPKDIDALMAVSYGVAGAAVATEGGAAKLARFNPKQFNALRAMGDGEESMLPVLVTGV